MAVVLFYEDLFKLSGNYNDDFCVVLLAMGDQLGSCITINIGEDS